MRIGECNTATQLRDQNAEAVRLDATKPQQGSLTTIGEFLAQSHRGVLSSSGAKTVSDIQAHDPIRLVLEQMLGKLGSMLQAFVGSDLLSSAQTKSVSSAPPSGSSAIRPSVTRSPSNGGEALVISPSVRRAATAPSSDKVSTRSETSTARAGTTTENRVNTSREGFLWKPRSENDGKLVVLFPPSLTGMVQNAAIHSSLPPQSDNLVEGGKFAGDHQNGGRAHFRFSSPGDSYPANSYVVAHFRDGSYTTFQIGNPGARNQG